jgi:thiol-disulfide isomerase/thioredoxin
MEGKPLPSFDLLLLDSSTHITSTQLSPEKPIVFFYFSPHCPYCRALTHEIVNRDNRLKEIQFVLLTPASITEVKEFTTHFELEKLPNIITAIDYNKSFKNYFNAERVPFLAVYNRKKILKQTNLGAMPTNEIKTIALD